MKHHTKHGFAHDDAMITHGRYDFENAPDRGMCYGGGGGGGGKGILRTVVTAAAVYYTGGLAASYFGAGTMAGVAAGAVAGGATAMGIGAVAGDGGEKNFGNFAGGAIGGGSAAYAQGAQAIEAANASNAAATANEVSMAGAGSGVPAADVAANAAGGGATTAGLSDVGAPAASDVVSQGAASPTTVAPDAVSTPGVTQGATQTAGLSTSTPIDYAAQDTGGMPQQTLAYDQAAQTATPTGAWDKIAAGAKKIPGLLVDKAADPTTQLLAGGLALSSAAGQGQRDKAQAAEDDRVRAQAEANRMNAESTAKKNAIGDTLTTKANNLDPAYTATQAGAAYGMGQDKAWQDRKTQLMAQGASPEQISSEERRHQYSTSLGKQTTYQDTYGKTQGTQNSTYGQAAGAYGTLNPSLSEPRVSNPTPGTATMLEDIFNLKGDQNRRQAGLNPAGAPG